MSENIKDPDDKPKGHDTWEKKSERFEVRLPFSKKQAFLEACEGQGDTPSEAIRRFIQIYLKRSQEDSLGLARRTLKHKRRQRLGFGLTGILAISAMSIVGPQGCASIKAQQLEAQRQSLFADYDVDGDGALTLGEIAANDKVLHLVLDVDDSQDISIDEFILKGRMQVQMQISTEHKLSYNSQADRRLVIFDLSNQEQILLSSWKVEPHSLAANDKMDRLVTRDYDTGAFKGHIPDLTLAFNDKGVFESFTIDLGKTKTDRSLQMEGEDKSNVSEIEFTGRPEINYTSNGMIEIRADEITYHHNK